MQQLALGGVCELVEALRWFSLCCYSLEDGRGRLREE